MSCQLPSGIKAVKRSPEYRRLHPELLSGVPADLWSTGSWGFVVFDMAIARDRFPDATGRFALFAVDLRDLCVVSVKVITTNAEQSAAEIEDLRQDVATHALPLPIDW